MAQYTTKTCPRCCGCRCVLGRWANRFSSSLVALSLYFFLFFYLLSFYSLTTRQLCAQWFALFCLAPPLLSVSLCLTRSSVHKVAVHLSARREGSYRQAGERTPRCRVIVEASQTGCGALSFLLSIPLLSLFFFPASCAFMHRATLFHSILCSAQYGLRRRIPNHSHT